MRKLLYVLVALALAMTASACGGTEAIPTSPSSNPGPTSVTLNSFIGGPAVGVTVTIDGRTATTDASGTATFQEGLRPGSRLVAEHPGFLKHECTYGGNPTHGHALYPVANEAERELVRWLAFNGEDNIDKMFRMTKPAAVFITGPHANDPVMIARTRAAVQELSAIHPFRFEAPSVGTVPVEITQDPTLPLGRPAVAEPRYAANDEILEVRIRYRGIDIVRGGIPFLPVQGTITHELGHAFGLGHDPSNTGVMCANCPSNTKEHFTPEERRVAEYMLSRPPGTRWEDALPGR